MPVTRPCLFLVGPGTASSEVLDVVLLPESGADEVVAAIRSSGASRWLLAGSGPVVAEVAAAALSGRAPVFGLAGLVVLAGGVPSTGRRVRPGEWVATVDGWTAPPELPVLLTADLGAVDAFWSGDVGRGPEVPADYAAVLASDRVTARTRGIHAVRVLADDPAYEPAALTPDELQVLRVLADLVVPQDGPPLDLAARVDARLARGEGDGWRFADLPADLEAYRAALFELADLSPGDVSAVQQVADGERPSRGRFTGEQLARWLEDAVVDLVRQWLAHPANLARTGYDGQATGGPVLLGFSALGSGQREAWEPQLVTP